MKRTAFGAAIISLGSWIAAGLGSCFADELATIPNPLIAVLGQNASVSQIEIVYRDGVLGGVQDRAARSYIEKTLPTDRKAAFEAFAQQRGLTDETAAERFSEFLALENLRARLPMQSGGGRAVKIAVEVESAQVKSTLGAAFLGGSPFPKTDMSFTISDATTGATVATGHTRGMFSYAADIEEARTRNALTYNWSGTDSNFRILAGTTNALAANIQYLFREPTFSVGRATLAKVSLGAPTYVTMPIQVGMPVHDITIVEKPAAAPIAAPGPDALTPAN